MGDQAKPGSQGPKGSYGTAVGAGRQEGTRRGYARAVRRRGGRRGVTVGGLAARAVLGAMDLFFAARRSLKDSPHTEERG